MEPTELKAAVTPENTINLNNNVIMFPDSVLNIRNNLYFHEKCRFVWSTVTEVDLTLSAAAVLSRKCECLTEGRLKSPEDESRFLHHLYPQKKKTQSR